MDSIPLNMKTSKIRLSKLDSEYPFRIVTPSKDLPPFRFKELDVAMTMFDLLKEEGHQAILSEIKVIDDRLKTSVIRYAAPKKVFIRKE